MFLLLILQNQQFELDLLKERGEGIVKLANPRNVTIVQKQLVEIDKEWRDQVSNLENRHETLSALSKHWEQLENRWTWIDTRLNAIGEKSKLMDTVVRSKQHLQDTYKSIQVSLNNLYYVRFENNIRCTCRSRKK